MVLALLLNCTQLLHGYTQHLYLMSLVGTFTGSAVMGVGLIPESGGKWGRGRSERWLGGKEKERMRGRAGWKGSRRR